MNKNKILKIFISTFLCVNLLNMNVFAYTTTYDGGRADTPIINNTTPNPGGGKTPSGGRNTVNYKPGSENYPLKNYAYTYWWSSTMENDYQNFLSATANDGQTIYRDARGTGKKWDYETDNGEKIYMENYNSAVVFNKNTEYKSKENRTTDYYTWTASGPTNWVIRGSQFQTVTFSMPGKYTVTSVPHQNIYTTKWTEISSKVFDLFSDGHTKIIKSNYNETEKVTTKTDVNRTDLTRTWTFTITPEEVGIPIIPSPNPDPVPVPEGEVTWEVELIE